MTIEALFHQMKKKLWTETKLLSLKFKIPALEQLQRKFSTIDWQDNMIGYSL